MVEANRLADDPEPAYPSSVSLREPPVGGSHAIRLHPQGEKEAGVTLLAGEALVRPAPAVVAGTLGRAPVFIRRGA